MLVRLLRSAPVVQHGDLLNAGNSAVFGARFFIIEFPLDILRGVIFEWNCRKTALLRAVMDKAVLADIEVSRACAAPPVMRPSIGQVILKFVEPRPALLAETLQLFVNPRLLRLERFELS